MSANPSNAFKYRESTSQLCHAKVKVICGELLGSEKYLVFLGSYCMTKVLSFVIWMFHKSPQTIHLEISQLVRGIKSYCCGSPAGDTTGEYSVFLSKKQKECIE